MALTKLTTDLNIIQALDDEPNDVGGLTAAQVKAKFDEGTNDIKGFLNNTMTVEVDAHISNTSNPHSVTKTQVGLGNCDNTSDANKPVSTSQQTALDLKSDKTNVLEKNNTTAFTPTANYHPATKKYADDVTAGVVLGQIPDGTITTAKLADSAVSNAKLVDGAVSTAKLASDLLVSIAKGGTGATTAVGALANFGNGYGTCTTAADTASKVVTLSGFSLVTGGVVGVAFTNVNSATSPTLNVNSTGAKAIYCNGAAASATQIPKEACFQFDGTYWQLLNPVGSTAQIVKGTYTGTGTSGINNKNTLTFDFPVRLLVVTGIRAATSTNYVLMILYGIPYSLSYNGGSELLHESGCNVVFSADAKTVSWYYASTDYLRQLNESGIVYSYTAFG